MTVPAVALNVAVLAPEATVTEAGTVNAAKLLDNPTAMAAFAAPVSVTLQVLVPPEATVAGLHCRLESDGAGAGAVMVMPNVRDTLSSVAVIVPV